MTPKALQGSADVQTAKRLPYSASYQKAAGCHMMFVRIAFRPLNDNDNDKRLGLTAKADHPDHKKYSTLKIKIDNEAVQKLHTS